ncbi:MAG: ATP-dependent DNA helicase, partial [Rhizobacter sp.]|nr:ATP-dependent DNA helicase [Rhizobacter sp.]
EGMAGHAVVAARRGAGYQAELGLSGEFEGLLVRGRADGWDAGRRRLEEVKTYRGDLAAMPQNRRELHWAQLRVYGALLCRQLGLDEVELALVYVDAGSQAETVLRETRAAADLQQVFESLCRPFLAWAVQESAHRARRDAALAGLAFPHGAFRRGQRELCEAVYRATTSGRCLMAQAPTGIGKTVGTLFAQLKAMPGQGLDKVIYLAAKTPGRALALEGLQTLQRNAPGAPPLRVLELVARDKACEHLDKACHGESCPLARGFYDRLPAARDAALATAAHDHSSLREVALAHRVCPYYLAQAMVRWSDVVVGDYNYWFDLNAMLHGMTVAEGWKVGVLVDEAHNLVERARGMYSATISRSQLAAVRRVAGGSIKRSIGRLERGLKALSESAVEGVPAEAGVDDAGDAGDPSTARGEPAPQRAAGYAVLAQPPADWLAGLQRCIQLIGEHLEQEPVIEAALLRFYFDALHFTAMHELFDRHSLCDLSFGAGVDSGTARTGKDEVLLCLRNIVPAPFLTARFEASRSSTLFSATLSPPGYYRDLLGLPADTVELDVLSPFEPGQLEVQLAGHISTRYAHRPRSLLPIVELMAGQFQRAPGNYLAFFSSFDYLAQVAALLRERWPQIEVWEQSRQMGEAERRQFLARFTVDGRGIAFAVLGGAFAEGIDLPGRRLIGAFIATLGLPQFNPVNEQMRQRMQALFGSGYDYAYLYPGLQKVVQAAGRVIRGPEDRGSVHLIDDRYARAPVRALLPRWWTVERSAPRRPREALDLVDQGR